MNDSTVREAYVLGNALGIELMFDGKHYNQISSKEMRAYFTDGKLRRNEAIGNVLSLYYIMEEKDSSLLYLNYMECDTMRMYISAEPGFQVSRGMIMCVRRTSTTFIGV